MECKKKNTTQNGYWNQRVYLSTAEEKKKKEKVVSLWRVILILQIALPDEEWRAVQQENIHR